ncbi:MAG: molecular chaperone HtpG [Polyangiaceae bacterium]
MEPTRHPFQAEVSQVLSLVIHSLYSNKEIFLRELISNASDALDKRRFAAVQDSSLLEDGEKLSIRIIPDAAAGTLTIWDNGVGMSAEELKKNLGTIAWSGSRDFVEKLKGAAQGADLPQLIGQFGVGFYSSFLVADRVSVTSRAAGSSEAHVWESTGTEGFSLDATTRDSVGTSVTLHLKQDQKEYLDDSRLRELVQHYSDYVAHPIELRKSGDGADEFEAINRASALWQRAAKDVTPEQYSEFYKHLTHDWEEPLGHRHFQIEGAQMFTGLIFQPRRAPFDLFDPEAKHGLRLHVRRVFVMQDCTDLVPRWLRFLRGVVDSEDLPLNVSRETLQDSRVIRAIRKQVTHQALELLSDLAQNKPADYETFWQAFGVVLKEGLYFEPEYKERVQKLMRFESSSLEKLVSLDEYIAAMPEGQNAIYYVLGPTKKVAASSPHLERVRKAGYDVLLMTDAVDTFALGGLDEYQGKPLVAVTSADLKLDEKATEEAAKDEPTPEAPKLLERFRELLKDKVVDVRASSRLTDSPACLVQPEGALPPHIERMLRAQKKDVPGARRILELNLTHPLVKSVTSLEEREPSSERVREWLELLHDQALLAEGSPIEDPAGFAKKLTRLLTRAAESEVAAAGSA